jgi:mono/diheme cytochrome c family protein
VRGPFTVLVALFVFASISVATSGPMVSITPVPSGASPAAASSSAAVPSSAASTGAAQTPIPNAQALAGAKVFAAHCASCHGAQLEGGAGPTLVGPDFAASVAQDRLSVGDVFGMVAYQMPYNAPASLSHIDYENVVAFLLVRNGQPIDPPGIVYERALKSTIPFIRPTP